MGGFIWSMQHDRVGVLVIEGWIGLGRLYSWLTPRQKAAVAAGFARGASVSEMASAFGVSATTVRRVRDQAALARRRVWHSPHRLSFAEREEIFAGVCRGESDSV